MADAIKQRTADISECSICCEPFVDPRSLPCVHSFCLECLKQYDKKKQHSGEVRSCPLCRQVFTIPAAGVDGLPKNFFLEHIMAIKASTFNSAGNQKMICDLCNDGERDSRPTPATGYCVECRLNLCTKCSSCHRKLPLTKTHSILSVEEKKNAQNLSKFHVIYCDTHKEEQLKLFCESCKVAVCLMCFAVNHNGHECSDINASAENFRKQLQDNRNLISCNSSTEAELKKLDTDKRELLQKIDSVQKKIQTNSMTLKSNIDKEQRKLEEELNKLKEKRLGYIEGRRAELVHQQTTTNSITQYTNELLEKGSPSDIARSASDILRRRGELFSARTKFNDAKLQTFSIEYDSALHYLDYDEPGHYDRDYKAPVLRSGQQWNNTAALLGWLTLNGKQVAKSPERGLICPYGCQQVGKHQHQQQHFYNSTYNRPNYCPHGFGVLGQCSQCRSLLSEVCDHGYDIAECPNDCMENIQRCQHGFPIKENIKKDSRL